jgi:hypothetical protein
MRRKNNIKPVTVEVSGKKMSLHDYLLTGIDRPLPKEPTHYIMADVVNRDLSIKRITVYFNPLDTWTNSDSCFFEQDKPKWIGTLIGNNLAFIDVDPNTIGYTFWVIEVGTNEVLHKGVMYSFCNYDDY